MNISLICVGKCKEKYWLDAIAEYEKRLSRYIKFSLIEVPDEKTDENASEKEEEQVKDTEGDRILSKIPDNAYVITMEINGESFDSVALSNKLSSYMVSGKSTVCFVIGGSLGLSKKVSARANEKWSFSKMTFPHQLMRVIFLEQIYRGFRIMNHEPYHK